MDKGGKGPVVLATMITLGLCASAGPLALQGSKVHTQEQVVKTQAGLADQAKVYSSMLQASIEEFQLSFGEEGLDRGDGLRRDANGNVIPNREEQQQQQQRQGNANYGGNNKIAKAAADAWNEFCNEGGQYNQGMYGSVTKARHDCSGYVHYVLGKCGIASPTTSSGWWGSAPAGFTLIGYYNTASEVNAVAQEGDVMSFSGHVHIAMGNGQCANWGGYGPHLCPTFPFNPPVAFPKANNRGSCKLYRYTGG